MINSEDSNLVRHAKQELEIARVEEDLRPSIIAAVSAFASYGHSGGSASVVVPMLNDLLRFRNISPLTDRAGEWNRIANGPSNGEDLWQSTRCSEAFSLDGGQTYYMLTQQRHWIARLIPWFVWRRLSSSVRTRLLYRMRPTARAGFIIGVGE